MYPNRMEGSKSNCGKKSARQEKIDTIAECIRENNTSGENSRRKLAAKARVSKLTANKIVKKALKMKPMRKVVTPRNAPKTLKTRHKVAVGLARLLDSGEINIDNVFFPRRNLAGHLCAREA